MPVQLHISLPNVSINVTFTHDTTTAGLFKCLAQWCHASILVDLTGHVHLRALNRQQLNSNIISQ